MWQRDGMIGKLNEKKETLTYNLFSQKRVCFYNSAMSCFHCHSP